VGYLTPEKWTVKEDKDEKQRRRRRRGRRRNITLSYRTPYDGE
jgi:hypothetical protein